MYYNSRMTDEIGVYITAEKAGFSILVLAITTTTVDVNFTELEDDIDDATVTVICPNGNTHPVEPKDLSVGDSSARFNFSPQLTTIAPGTWTVDGVDYRIFDGQITGELERIYSGGEAMRIDGVEYNVAAMPAFNDYLNRMSAATHAILGSEVTVSYQEDAEGNVEIVDLEEIVLESKEYRSRPMNDIVDYNDWYNLTLKGQEGTEVTGDAVTASMDGLTVEGVDFENYVIAVNGDYVEFKDLGINNESLTVNGYGFDANLNEMVTEALSLGGRDANFFVDGDLVVNEDPGDPTNTGDLEINERGVSVTADNIIAEEVDVDGRDAVVTVADEIDADVVISSSDTTINAVTVTQDLTIATGGTGATLNIEEQVEGTVTLDEAADIGDLRIGEDLIVNAGDIELSELNVEGMLEFGANADGIEISDSVFNLLSDNNNAAAENIIFENVEFSNLYQTLTSNTQDDLEVGDTFTINGIESITFNNVTWSVDNFDINIDADGTTIENETPIPGDLVINAHDVVLADVTVEGLMTFTSGDDVVFNDVIFEDDINLANAGQDDEAPEFNNGEIRANVLNFVQGARINEVTFTDEDETIDVDESIFINNATFVGNVLITSTNYDLEEGFVGGVIQGDLTVGVTAATIRLDGVELQGDVDLEDTADLRLRNLVLNPTEASVIQVIGAGVNATLHLRDVEVNNDYTIRDGANDLDIVVARELHGNGNLTIEDINSYNFASRSVINEVTFEADIFGDTFGSNVTFNENAFEAVGTVTDEIVFNNNTFEAGLADVTAGAAFNGDLFEDDLTVNNADATLDDIRLDRTTGIDLELGDAAHAHFVAGQVNDLNDVEGDWTPELGDLSFTDMTFADDAFNGDDINFSATFNNNTFEGATALTISSSTNDDAVFNGDLFETDITLDGDEIVFNDIRLDDGGVDVTLTDAEFVHFVDGQIDDLLAVGAWAEVDNLIFEGITFADDALPAANDVNFLATFEESTFEGATAITISEDATFNTVAFEMNVTITSDGAVLEALSFDTASNDRDLDLQGDVTITNLTVEGANDFTIVINAPDIVFEGTFDYTDLGGVFEIDTSAGHDFENNATWVPDEDGVIGLDLKKTQ